MEEFMSGQSKVICTVSTLRTAQLFGSLGLVPTRIQRPQSRTDLCIPRLRMASFIVSDNQTVSWFGSIRQLVGSRKTAAVFGRAQSSRTIASILDQAINT